MENSPANTELFDSGEMREKLQAYIRKAPFQKVQALFTLLESEIEIDMEKEEDFFGILEEDIEAWEAGKNPSFKWQDVKKEASDIINQIRAR